MSGIEKTPEIISRRGVERKGLWAAPQSVPPWEWRTINKRSAKR